MEADMATWKLFFFFFFIFSSSFCLSGIHGADYVSMDFTTPSIFQFGSEITTTVTFTIPANTSVQMAVEVFPIEPNDGYVMAVWPVSIDTTGLTVSDTPNMTQEISPVMGEVFNTIYYEVGQVNNSGSAAVDMTIVFGAAVVRRVPGLNATNATARVSVAALYTGQGIYATSKLFEAPVDTAEVIPTPTYTGTFACAPTALELDYFAFCNATFTTASRFSSPVILTIGVGNEGSLLPSTFSVGNMRELERRMKHLTIPEGFRRNVTYGAAYDGFNSSVSLSIGHVAKPAGSGDIVAEFVIAANKNPMYVEQTILLKGEVLADGLPAGTFTGSINTVAIQKPDQQLEASMVNITLLNNSTRPGGLFRYEVAVNLQGQTGKYKVYFGTQPSDPGITVCAMTIKSKEIDTPHVLLPKAYPDHLLGYNIYNTKQYTDPEYALVKYQVWSQFEGADGTSASIDFTLEGGTPVPADGSVVLKALNSTPPTFQSGMFETSWSVIEPNRAVGIRAKLKLEKDKTFPKVRFLAIPVLDTAVNFPLKICSAFLADVNDNLPCLKAQMDNYDSSATTYFKSAAVTPYGEFANSLDVTLGDISSVSTDPGELIYEVHLVLPWGVPSVEMPPVFINMTNRTLYYQIGVQVDDLMIWTKLANLTLGNQTYRENYQLGSNNASGPELYLMKNIPTATVTENAPLHLVANIVVGPGMTHDMDLVFKSPAGAKLCRPSLKLSGRYLSCVPGGDWRRGQRFIWFNMSRMYYEYDANGNTYARLSLLGLTNVGTQPITVKANSHNSLLINFPLHVLPGFAGGVVTAELRGSVSGTVLYSSTYTIGPAAPAATPPPPPTGTVLMFTVVPSVYTAKKMGIIELQIKIPPNTAHEMKVSIVGSASLPICNSHVVFVGELMPCLNGSLATHTISSDGASVEVNLGLVCRIDQTLKGFVDPDKVRIRVAFMPAPGSTASQTFTADVLYGGVKQNINLVSSAITYVASIPDVNENATVIGYFNNNFTAVKATSTGYFNVSLPYGTTIPVKIKLMALPSFTRPSVTISNVKFVYSGRGLRCSDVSIQDTLTKVKSTDYYSSHNDSAELDTIEIDFGYLSNAGFTALAFDDPPEDHVFTISVDAYVNDAYWNDNNAYVGVRMEITSGGNNTVTFGDATTQVIHTPADLPILNSSLIAVDPVKVYQTSEELKLIFRLAHLPNSMAEPAEVRLLMYLPYGGYVTYDRINATGIVPQVSLSRDLAVLTTKYDQFRFFDTSEVMYTFKINPNANRHFGIRPYIITLPYELHVRLAQRLNVEGYRMFPDNNVGRLPPQVNHITINLEPPPCYDELGIGSVAVIPDCLFTASSVLDSTFMPNFSRISSTTPWAPRVSGDKEWIEVDLMNFHQISVIKHNAHADYLQAKDLVIASSIDRVVWEDKLNVTLPQQTGMLVQNLSRSISGRYFRIYIMSSYGSGKAVGFRFAFSGCLLSGQRNITQVCNTTVSSPTGQPGLAGRHFAVDTDLSYAYLCHYSVDEQENKCYASTTGGLIWNALPNYIGVILGYSPAAKKVYAANYIQNMTFFTVDGINWAPATAVEANTSMATATWVPSKAVPYVASVSSQTIGSWSADASGVLKGGSLKASWGTCCEHTVK